jgi:hypothetical protein
MGLGSPPGFLKTKNAIAGIKTPFALRCSLYRWKGLEVPRMSHLDIYSTSYGRKKGPESNSQFDSRPLKVRNRPDPGVCGWTMTHYWEALKENYKFSSDLVPIGGWSEKLWTPKVPRVQTRTVLGLHFGSPGKKCHLNASAAERHREYYLEEGAGFPRVRVMVSQVSPKLPMACPNTKSAPECELTNLSVSLMQVQISE